MNQITDNAARANPLVSVVIPTYNSSSYIENTISSILDSCTNFPLEIILVDDCSNDIANLKLMAEKHKSIFILEKKEKSNAADSRNIGLKASNGDYVFFLDSDDSFTKTHILRRLQIHDSSEYGLVFGSYIERNNGIDTKKKIPKYTSNNIRDYIFDAGGDVRSSTISICKRNYKDTVFDARQFKHQDWGYAIRAYDNGEKIHFDHDAGVIIDNTQNTERMSNRMNTSASKYFLDRYIYTPDHIINFARGHLKLSIITEDQEGLRFLREILIPLLQKTTISKKIKITAICLATLPLSRTVLKLFFILKK